MVPQSADLGGALMSDDGQTKSWFKSLPGVLATVTATITALAGLIAAIPALWNAVFGTQPAPTNAQSCLPGYVWRETISEDHVCVTLQAHLRAMQDNQLASSRRDPRGGPYGADTCLGGFVWRDAFEGDHVCVTPETRGQTAEDNREAALHIKH
jgi:hypothetical protein